MATSEDDLARYIFEALTVCDRSDFHVCFVVMVR